MRTKTEKRVFWFDDGKRPNVADALEKEQDIILHRLAFNGPQADNWGAMSASQAYCITSTRQELPDEYKCHAALLALDNVIATYHTAGVTHDSRINMAEWNAEQVAGILRGERPPRLINPETWELFAQRFERVFGVRAAN